MKKFGKIIICIIVVILAIVLANSINKQNTEKTSTNTSNHTQNNANNESGSNTNKPSEDEYIGLEENIESKENQEEQDIPEEDNTVQNLPETTKPELTGKDKAVDLVQKQYATTGQTVTFDHMEGNNYVIKMNAGTAITWYLVNGTTWEAEEY